MACSWLLYKPWSFTNHSPMDSKSMFCFPSLLLLLLFSLQLHLSTQANIISPGQSLTGNQTLVSQNGTFELGFFTPGSSGNYYIGIWYKKIKKQTVVWVANRESPLPNTSSQLKIAGDGNLVLLSGSSGSAVWSTNSSLRISSNSSTTLLLLDNGNLVLREESDPSAVIWQSFDHPTDTWLPEGKLGLNKVTGEVRRLTSWRSLEDPSPGPFSLEFDTVGIQFKLLWNGSRLYWRSGAWNGQSFSLIAESTALSSPLLSNRYNFSYIANSNESIFTYVIKEKYLTIRFVMDVSTGKIQTVLWLESTQEWMPFWTEPNEQCDVYSLCGAFSTCNSKTKPFCTCLAGFEPRSLREWNLNDRSDGCRRKNTLECVGNSSSGNGKKDQFQVIPNMQLPSNPVSVSGKGVDECEALCLNNCSCTAYAFDNSCKIWIGDLLNIQQPSDSSDTKAVGDLHLRLAHSEQPSSRDCTGKVVVAVTCSVLGIVVILAVILMLFKGRERSKMTEQHNEVDGYLTPFTYTELKAATNNFSQKLGCGSFGSVYKGKLPDSTVIAVKKLEGLRQGEKQFRMELSTIGMIHHVNLVRLRGFCSKASEKLLVYDFMPNGSLDYHLFQKNHAALDWKTRYQIAIGIAKGLNYLHEKCRDCIIHCDIKPANILLDEEFCPKLTDFGMAKLLGHEFSRVLTTMRGTFGYIAPEWISGQPITTKADVYSYGVMLLEIISGSRNTHQSQDGALVSFPFWAATKLSEGDIISILDCKLEGNANMDEVDKACRVACWCIQENEDSRPSTRQIIQVLEGVQQTCIPPVPWYLQHLVEGQ